MRKLYFTICIVILLAGLIFVNAAEEVDIYNSGSGSGTANSKTKAINQEVKTEADIGNILGLDKGLITGKNVKIERPENGMPTITFLSKEGYLKYKNKDGSFTEYKNLDKVKVKANGKETEFDPKLILNKDGGIEEAYFTSVDGGKYVLDNQEINVPKGGSLIYQKKDGKGIAQVLVPTNSKIISPKVMDSNNPDRLSKISYMTSDNSAMVLENNMKIQGAIVSYIDGKLGFSGKDVRLAELVIRNKDASATTYLDFNGKVSDVKGAYISMNPGDKTIVIGTNTKQDSPAVMFQKGNPYGLNIEANDFFAAKVLGNDKQSYFMLTDKDRTSKDLVPLGKAVGNVAFDEDNAAIGTYKNDGEIYKKVYGNFLDEFKDVPNKKTTVPIEIGFYKLDANGKEIPVSTRKVIQNGKETIMEERVVISNRNQFVIGPNPSWISGNPINGRLPFIKSGVSNRVSYNYVQFTPEGINKYFGIKINFDEYSRRTFKESDYKQLFDFLINTPKSTYQNVRSIDFVRSLGGLGGETWNGAYIRISVSDVGGNTISAPVLLHEMVHSSMDNNRNFNTDWASVGGVMNDQPGTWNDAHYFALNVHKDMSQTLRTNAQARAMYAVLTKYGAISQPVFDDQFAHAGLQTGTAAVQKYINEAKGRR